MAAPIRLGLIGVGRWGKVYLKTLLEFEDRCTVTHVCTSRSDNASLVPHPVTVMASWQALLHAPCDAVIIATPAATHAEILEACVAAGKPCIVEKPLCLDVSTAERLHHLVTSRRVPVLIDHTQVFDPAYQALKQRVREAGDPIRVVIAEGMGFGPFRSDLSVLWDRGPHDVSLCLDLLGRAPRQVAALAGPEGPTGQPEQVSLRLDFEDEACAWIQTGVLSFGKRRRLTVFTDQRMYHWDAHAAERLTELPIAFPTRYVDGLPNIPAPTALPVSSREWPMNRLMTYFIEGLQGGDRQYFGTALGLEVVRVLSECERACVKAEARSAAVRRTISSG